MSITSPNHKHNLHWSPMAMSLERLTVALMPNSPSFWLMSMISWIFSPPKGTAGIADAIFSRRSSVADLRDLTTSFECGSLLVQKLRLQSREGRIVDEKGLSRTRSAKQMKIKSISLSHAGTKILFRVRAGSVNRREESECPGNQATLGADWEHL